MDRLRISLKRSPAMTVNRISVGNLKLVYVICASKRIRYPDGSTPVVYIGTTKRGIERIAESAARRSSEVLDRHGVNSFEVRIVTCGVRQRVRTWEKLERAMLIAFRDRYGEKPACNVVGKGIKETDEFDYFARKRVVNVLTDLEESGIATDTIITE